MKKTYSFLFLVACSNHNAMAQLLCVNSTNVQAAYYVGNIHTENGQMQLELLLREGLQTSDYVLEIGCGALVASIPIMSFLDKQRFVGIDPNKWLIDNSLQVQENSEVAVKCQPIFLYRSDFDASSTGLVFNYVLAHSVISRAPLWQFKLFLKNCAQVLCAGGKVIFSLRLTRPNEWDPTGIKNESTTDKWQYPDNTFFHEETVLAEASKWFSKIERKPEYTKLILSTDNSAFHDWFVLTK